MNSLYANTFLRWFDVFFVADLDELQEGMSFTMPGLPKLLLHRCTTEVGACNCEYMEAGLEVVVAVRTGWAEVGSF